ncbi:FASCICLIN-like arabinogalactan protein 8 [Artemisia annua]|uniref:FASCICLIN-like arabinogalactan protein 8 n=1 Tax=Artemisia annua TaxID=35608 RepID=A0A2U1MGQ3_ARTAN|nr:FASCICLIN-like arabinogalactan protein 8 [Artemisia annua]
MTIIRLITLTLTLMITMIITTVTSHNITDILSNFPEYSVYNDYLTKTRLNDEINSHETVTVLVLNNNMTTKLGANEPLAVMKTVLSIHVLLDFFDREKLLKIGGGSQVSTTLYQTTGHALQDTGYVNITDLPGGKVGFGSGNARSKLGSLFVKDVKEFPYNISVLEINSPIIAPGILNTPWIPVNISSLLENAGCKIFLKMLKEQGVLTVYEGAVNSDITVFAPSDDAFNKVLGLPEFKKLQPRELISLLYYHAIPTYVPKASLASEKNKNVTTFATTPIQNFYFTIKSSGDSFIVDTGVDVVRIENTIIDASPVSIFKIENVLLPIELFNGTSISTPAPAPAAPTPESSRSAPGPVSTDSSSTSGPAGGPDQADGPDADVGDNNANDASDGKHDTRSLLVDTR